MHKIITCLEYAQSNKTKRLVHKHLPIYSTFDQNHYKLMNKTTRLQLMITWIIRIVTRRFQKPSCFLYNPMQNKKQKTAGEQNQVGNMFQTFLFLISLWIAKTMSNTSAACCRQGRPKPMQPMQLHWAPRLRGPKLFIFARYSLRSGFQ